MKKLFVIMILSFLIFGLSLNAETKEENVTRDLTGLAPHQQFNSSDTRHVIQPNPNRDPDYQVYGYNAYDQSGTNPDGPVTFILNDPAGLTSLAATTSGNFIAGACWIADEETWYGSQYGGGLYSIDITTGAMTFIAATTESFMGIDYDDASGIMYGSDGTSLYTIDWTTGATTLIGSHNVGYTMIGIAGDGEGNMYGVTVDFSLASDLYLIDLATGNATSIGSTGGQLLYAQDIAFDKDDGVLYSAAYFGEGTPPGLYSIDTNTAAMTGLGDFPGEMEVSGFAIPYTLAEDDAPAAVSDLVVTPDAGGLLLCDIIWVNPDLTFNGDPLTELLETRVYRDGALIYTNSNPGIGDFDGYTDAPTSSGMYNYAVAAYNSVGEGPSVSFETWVGEDVPAAVTDLLLEESNGNGYLTWINPTVGLNGGAFNNPILGYHLERNDGVVIEVTGVVTEYTDDTIPSDGTYSYSVQAYNSVGNGGIVISNEVWIGDSPQYCESTYTNEGADADDWIENVTFGTIDNTSAQEVPLSYGDFTGISTDIESGTTYPLCVTLGFEDDYYYTQHVRVWFDWNQNGFLETVESFYIGIAPDDGINQICGDILVPVDATPGETRMRIIEQYSNDPGEDGACDGEGNHTTTWGETEDYTVNIVTDPVDPGYIEGTVVISDGAGDVEDVVVEAGGETTNPAADGTYSLELQPGTYDVTATLAGYDTEVLLDIIVTEGNATTGVDFTLVTDGDEIVIAATELNGNYPNPFNPVTTIAYSTKDVGNVTLEVYNLRGQLVKTLVNEVKETGNHTVTWNGTDDSNKSVSSGVYFYKMVSEGNIGRYTSTKKMILMK